MHLFDVEIPEKNLNLKESTYVIRGENIVSPVTTPAGNLALSIVSFLLSFVFTEDCLRYVS